MGCSETKNKRVDYPFLLCTFEEGNKKQKEYCEKLIENFKHIKIVRYEIKSTESSIFEITIQIKGQTYQIQNIFDENEIDNTLLKIYDLLRAENIEIDINIKPKEDSIHSINILEENYLNEMKEIILDNQTKYRNNKKDSDKISEHEKNKHINDVLEDMCKFGAITKQEIRKEKAKNPEKFIETSKA